MAGKKIYRIHRYLRIFFLLISIGSIILSLLRFLPKNDLPARTVPDGLDKTSLSARYVQEEGVLAVTQTMEITNRSGDDWPELMLQLPANASGSGDLLSTVSSRYLVLDWAEADGKKLEPEYVSGEHTACLLPVSVSNGNTVTIQLRCRLFLPEGLHRFGQDSRSVRLCCVFPALGIWEDKNWRTDETSPVGDGWNAPMTRFTFDVELPQGWSLAAGCSTNQSGLFHSGVLAAADDLCLVLFKEPVCHVTSVAGGTRLTVFGADASRVGEASGLYAAYLKRLSGLYGPSPMDTLSVCILPYDDNTRVFPGLIILSEEQFDRWKQNPADIAWPTAWQWFGAGFSTDGFREHWLSSALSEWAGQQAMGLVKGADALRDYRRTFVDEAMRENLHLSLTPGSPLSSFPDEETLKSVTRGRGSAFLAAVDTMTGGRMDEFLKELASSGFYRRLTEEVFLERLSSFFSMDFSPLLTDYIHTLF